MRIEQDQESWDAGYQDGLEGTRERSSALDQLAYSSGYIEGKAVRLEFKRLAKDPEAGKRHANRIEELLRKRRTP